MKYAAMIIGAVCLVGCAADSAQAPAPRSAPPPGPVVQPPAPRPSSSDQCGAAEAQKYVGRPRTEIPVPLIPDWQRVACTTCPVTQEFMPKRLNFFYDAETGIVKEVKCG